MRKTILTVIIFTLFVGVVSASSINGDYKGNPIVILKSEGKELTPLDVPAVILDSRTMVPISMLRQIGLEVTWNENDYSVDVTLPQTIDIPKLTKELNAYNVEFVNYSSNGKGLNQLSFHYSLTLSDSTKNTGMYNDLDQMFMSVLNYDLSTVKVYDIEGSNLSVHMDTLRDFYTGNITVDQFWENVEISIPETSQPTYNEPVYPIPNSNIKNCEDINANYDQQVIETTNLHNRRGGTYSGGLQHDLDIIEKNRKNELTLNGCTQ